MNLFKLTGEILLNGVPQAQDQLKGVSKEASNSSDVMTKAFNKIGVAVASAFSIGAITRFGSALVSASAEVSNEVGTFQNVFGQYSDTVMKSMDDLSKKTGVVSTRLMNNITTISSKFRTLGYSMEESIDLASDSLSMATDLASYWGMELDDAINNLDAFMNGQYKMARNIGIYADDTTVAEYAVQQGVIKTTKEFSSLTDAMQQNIRLDFAKETMKTMGALDSASKGADDYLNVVGNLNETWRQFKASLGEPILQNVVIPVMKTFTGVLESARKKIEEVKGWLDDNSEVIDTWVDRLIVASTFALGLLTVLGAFKILQQISGWMSNLGTLMGTAMANPFVLVIAGLVTLGTVLVDAYKNNEEFRDKVNETWNQIKEAINPIIETIVSKFGEFPKAEGIVSIAMEGIRKIIDGFVYFIQEAVLPIISGMAKFISDHIDPITTIISNDIDIVKAIIQGFLSLIKGDWEGTWNSIVEIFSKTWENIMIVIEPVVDWLKDVFDLMVERFVEAKDNIVQKINDIKESISDKFTEVVENMKSFGHNIVEGLWNGIEDVKDWFTQKWEDSFIMKMVNGAKDLLGIHSPSTVFAEIGGFLVQGLEEGVEEESGTAFDYIGNFGQGIIDKMSESTIGKRILKAFGIEIVDEVIEGIEAEEPKVEAPVKETFWTKFKKWMDKTKSDVKKWWNGLGDTFKDKMSGINDIVSNYGQQIADYFMNLSQAIEQYQETVMQNTINGLERELKNLKKINDDALKSEEDKNNKEKKSLKERLYAGKISYADYVKAIEKMDDDLQKSKDDRDKEVEAKEAEIRKQKEELGRKNFEAQKKNEIAMIAINTASAIIRGYAELGIIAGSVNAVAQGTLAGVQIAEIEKQEYVPAFAEGGIVDDPTHALIGESGREAVVPLENNLEWVGGLAHALEPIVADTRIDYTPVIYEVRDQIQDFKESVVAFLSELIGRETTFTIDGRAIAQATVPYMNIELGNLSRMRNRGI